MAGALGTHAYKSHFFWGEKWLRAVFAQARNGRQAVRIAPDRPDGQVKGFALARNSRVAARAAPDRPGGRALLPRFTPEQTEDAVGP